MIDIDGRYYPDEEVEQWEYENDKAKHDEGGKENGINGTCRNAERHSGNA